VIPAPDPAAAPLDLLRPRPPLTCRRTIAITLGFVGAVGAASFALKDNGQVNELVAGIR
jgi:hypothetical protein